MNTPKRILAIHVTRIGDTLLCGPSLRALKQAYPNAEIDFLGHPKRFEVLESFPALRRVGHITKKTAPFRGWQTLLCGKPYDLAVVWGNDQPLVQYALRVARRVVAWPQRNQKVTQRLHAAVTMPSDAAIPLADWQLCLIEQGLGITTTQRHVEYLVREEERLWAQSYLRQMPGKGRLVGLVVETFGTPYREWSIDSFADLCRRLNAFDPGLRFLLFGVGLDNSKTGALKAVLGDRLHVLVGESTLRQSASLMNELDLFVSLDTGPSHIAAALGVPAVALFHCMRRGPLVLSPRWPERITMVEHPLSSELCSFDVNMSAITVDTVYEAAITQLEQGRI